MKTGSAGRRPGQGPSLPAADMLLQTLAPRSAGPSRSGGQLRTPRGWGAAGCTAPRREAGPSQGGGDARASPSPPQAPSASWVAPSPGPSRRRGALRVSPGPAVPGLPAGLSPGPCSLFCPCLRKPPASCPQKTASAGSGSMGGALPLAHMLRPHVLFQPQHPLGQQEWLIGRGQELPRAVRCVRRTGPGRCTVGPAVHCQDRPVWAGAVASAPR